MCFLPANIKIQRRAAAVTADIEFNLSACSLITTESRNNANIQTETDTLKRAGASAASWKTLRVRPAAAAQFPLVILDFHYS